MKCFSESFLEFFKELASNNNKDWFDLNRKRYENDVKKPFYDFVGACLDYFSKYDENYKNIKAGDCIFRINRDIRFSKDKSPYKLYYSAVIAPSGKKSKAVNGIYFEISPESFNLYGGVYEIDKDDLYEVREGISKNLERFETIINDVNFKKHFGSILGEKNKIINKEFRDTASKQELIMNKQWYFMTKLPAETVLQSNLIEVLEEYYLSARPIEQFFSEFITRN